MKKNIFQINNIVCSIILSCFFTYLALNNYYNLVKFIFALIFLALSLSYLSVSIFIFLKEKALKKEQKKKMNKFINAVKEYEGSFPIIVGDFLSGSFANRLRENTFIFTKTKSYEINIGYRLNEVPLIFLSLNLMSEENIQIYVMDKLITLVHFNKDNEEVMNLINKEYNKEENSFNLETDIIQMIIDEM